MPQRYSQQHQLLLDWEQKGNNVFYATQVFHTNEEMNNYFLNKRVIEKSVFFTPSDIGQLPDNSDHCITFLPEDDHGYLWSEPKRIRAYPGKDFTSRLSENTLINSVERKKSFKIDYEYLNLLSKSIIKTASQFMDVSQNLNTKFLTSNTLPDLKVAYLSRAFLECEFLIVITGEKEVSD